ncbi:MAG: CopG family transcriptional regulator [Planctomycetota bacterium]
MPTAQVTLTDAESQEIELISQLRGKTPAVLMREAVEHMLEEYQHEKRLAALRQVRGIWQNREDLPTLEELRSEWNRERPQEHS